MPRVLGLRRTHRERRRFPQPRGDSVSPSEDQGGLKGGVSQMPRVVLGPTRVAQAESEGMWGREPVLGPGPQRPAGEPCPGRLPTHLPRLVESALESVLS